MIREVVQINESKCDGCGLCVPACEEGAIRIVNGKAKLVSDRLCDGLGACLGHCPRGAITIERRAAEEFDEAAVHAAQAAAAPPSHQTLQTLASERPAATHLHGGGCPGSRLVRFQRDSEPAPATSPATPQRAELTHWPVQLRLLPPQAPVLRNARLLIAADCVPVAYASFQQEMLKDRAVLIGCPKFDDLAGYTEKLTAILALNDLEEVVVARMEVPCCLGITAAVEQARAQAGVDTPVREIVIGVDGTKRGERVLEPAAAPVQQNCNL